MVLLCCVPYGAIGLTLLYGIFCYGILEFGPACDPSVGCRSEGVDNAPIAWASNFFIAIVMACLAMHILMTTPRSQSRQSQQSRRRRRQSRVLVCKGVVAFLALSIAHALWGMVGHSHGNDGTQDGKGVRAYFLWNLLAYACATDSILELAGLSTRCVIGSTTTTSKYRRRRPSICLGGRLTLRIFEGLTVIAFLSICIGSLWCAGNKDVLIGGSTLIDEVPNDLDDVEIPLCVTFVDIGQVAFTATTALFWMATACIFGAFAKRKADDEHQWFWVLGLPVPLAAAGVVIFQTMVLVFHGLAFFALSLSDQVPDESVATAASIAYHYCTLMTGYLGHNLIVTMGLMPSPPTGTTNTTTMRRIARKRQRTSERRRGKGEAEDDDDERNPYDDDHDSNNDDHDDDDEEEDIYNIQIVPSFQSIGSQDIDIEDASLPVPSMKDIDDNDDDHDDKKSSNEVSSNDDSTVASTNGTTDVETQPQKDYSNHVSIIATTTNSSSSNSSSPDMENTNSAWIVDPSAHSSKTGHSETTKSSMNSYSVVGDGTAVTERMSNRTGGSMRRMLDTEKWSTPNTQTLLHTTIKEEGGGHHNHNHHHAEEEDTTKTTTGSALMSYFPKYMFAPPPSDTNFHTNADNHHACSEDVDVTESGESSTAKHDENGDDDDNEGTRYHQTNSSTDMVGSFSTWALSLFYGEESEEKEETEEKEEKEEETATTQTKNELGCVSHGGYTSTSSPQVADSNHADTNTTNRDDQKAMTKIPQSSSPSSEGRGHPHNGSFTKYSTDTTRTQTLTTIIKEEQIGLVGDEAILVKMHDPLCQHQHQQDEPRQHQHHDVSLSTAPSSIRSRVSSNQAVSEEEAIGIMMGSGQHIFSVETEVHDSSISSSYDNDNEDESSSLPKPFHASNNNINNLIHETATSSDSSLSFWWPTTNTSAARDDKDKDTSTQLWNQVSLLISPTSPSPSPPPILRESGNHHGTIQEETTLPTTKNYLKGTNMCQHQHHCIVPEGNNENGDDDGGEARDDAIDSRRALV